MSFLYTTATTTCPTPPAMAGAAPWNLVGRVLADLHLPHQSPRFQYYMPDLSSCLPINEGSIIFNRPGIQFQTGGETSTSIMDPSVGQMAKGEPRLAMSDLTPPIPALPSPDLLLSSPPEHSLNVILPPPHSHPLKTNPLQIKNPMLKLLCIPPYSFFLSLPFLPPSTNYNMPLPHNSPHPTNQGFPPSAFLRHLSAPPEGFAPVVCTCSAGSSLLQSGHSFLPALPFHCYSRCSTRR